MKKAISILLTMAMMVALAACQPTPQEAIVVKNDVERLVEQAGNYENGTQMNDLVIPEDDYSFVCTGLDGRLNITVDATIMHPDTAEMPILRVAKTGFFQDAVTGIFNYLFPDDKPFDIRENSRAKADIEKEILDMKKRLADDSYASELGFDENEYRSMIEQAEAEYAAAPDTALEAVRSDGTMRITKNQSTGSYYSLKVCSEPTVTSASKILSVNSADSASEKAMTSELGSYLSYHDSSAPEYVTLGIKRTDGTDVPAELTISFDEAIDLCDGFFAAAGLSNDFCFGSAFLVDDRGIGEYSGSGKEMGTTATNYAYKIYYTRKIDAIPTFVNMDWARTDTEYSIPWGYECVRFTIDNSGIVDLSWDNPIEILETIQQSASLKPFDEIMGIFETMVKVQYEAETDLWTGGRGKMDVAIDAIQLCLVRIREQNSASATGLLVPAWVFYGNNKLTFADGNATYDLDHGSTSSWNKEPFPVFIINAVDGSIIDLGRGY